MQQGVYHNEKIERLMILLAKRLQNTGGKKVYEYFKADVRKIVNEIVDTLAKEEVVMKCYESWKECQNEVYHTYKDSMQGYPPLSELKKFKSIKNMVITEVVKLGNDYFYYDDEKRESHEKSQRISLRHK